MVKIINGKLLAEKIKDQIVKEIKELNNLPKDKTNCPDVRPNLAIILIGEREDSKLYVNLKEKEAKKIGIDTHLYKCQAGTSQQEILDLINYLNKDELIDAILVQLPLPAGLDTDTIVKAISPNKDVDRFHPGNLKTLLSTCNHDHVIPPVFAAVLAVLNSIGFDNITGKQVCVIANSNIFGKSLAHVLKCRGGQTEVVRVDDKNLPQKTKQADILVTAVGQPEFIKADMIKDGVVIVDIGITKQGKLVKGDADQKSVQDKASYITPVPGGIGPLTIAMLFKNTLAIFKNRR